MEQPFLFGHFYTFPKPLAEIGKKDNNFLLAKQVFLRIILVLFVFSNISKIVFFWTGKQCVDYVRNKRFQLAAEIFSF